MIFDSQNLEGTKPSKEILQEDWVRPVFRKKFLAILGGDTKFEEQATEIREALDLTAKILAASPENNVNLSGQCYVAIKTTDEFGRVHIDVRPTLKREAGHIEKIENGSHRLPGEKFSARALHDELIKLATPLSNNIAPS